VSVSSYITAGMLVIIAAGGGPPTTADPPPDCESVLADPVTRSFGMMLVGMTPSTHDGRRKLLAGVEGGELTGEMVTRSGADPLRFDAATDVPYPSSSDGLPPEDSPGRVEQSDLSIKESSRLQRSNLYRSVTFTSFLW